MGDWIGVDPSIFTHNGKSLVEIWEIDSWRAALPLDTENIYDLEAKTFEEAQEESIDVAISILRKMLDALNPQYEPCKKEYYGGTLNELHPERTEVINNALDRFENGEDTEVDRFILWADVVISSCWSKLERLGY